MRNLLAQIYFAVVVCIYPAALFINLSVDGFIKNEYPALIAFIAALLCYALHVALGIIGRLIFSRTLVKRLYSKAKYNIIDIWEKLKKASRSLTD